MDPIYTRRVIHGHEIYSAHLSETRTIKVYLPPGYRDDARYPVLYCHDGNEFLSHGRLATLATQGILEGKLHPFLIAVLPVHHQHRTDDYAPDGVRSTAYSDFVATECMPFVERTYPVISDAGHRAMAGISLGAAASLQLHVRHPGLFGHMLLFSGAYYDTLQTNWAQSPRLAPLRVWMVVGRQETAVETPRGQVDFVLLNRMARDQLTDRGVEVDYREDDGTHLWGFWQSWIPRALQWLDGHLFQ